MDETRQKMKDDIMRLLVNPLLKTIAEKQSRIAELEDKLKGLTDDDLKHARASAADRISG